MRGCRESPPSLAALCGPAKLVAAAATGRGLPPGSAVLLTDLTVRRLRTRRESKCRQGSAAVPVVQSLRRPVARRRRPSGQATPGQGPESFGVRGVTHRGSVAHRVVFAVSGTQTVTACCLMRTFSCLVVPRAPPSSS